MPSQLRSTTVDPWTLSMSPILTLDGIFQQYSLVLCNLRWGKDGHDNKLYILQARPETVQSQITTAKHEKYKLKSFSKKLASGRAIGQKIGVGKVRIVLDAKDMNQVQKGDILVADMTDPNWEPVMKRAAAVVTNRGGRTCHAAIIARELGIPAIVGCGHATEKLSKGELVTVSCTEGDTGYVYKGALEYDVITHDVSAMPDIPVDIKMNGTHPFPAILTQTVFIYSAPHYW